MEIHDDVLHIAQSLAEFFQGHGVTAFFDAQQLDAARLAGHDPDRQPARAHVNTVHENAINTDQQLDSQSL
ncbi:hypothetical protein [Mycobacterium tilburgii]|uniref:hypothetical protein n=1 Tax=Mycobacterium tilburgii TaxID=44467 RepID=UPI0021B3FC64|nr:hypothetical protein [Mycobacterium tilburgii]